MGCRTITEGVVCIGLFPVGIVGLSTIPAGSVGRGLLFLFGVLYTV